MSTYKVTCRIQNPDIPRAGRGGAGHGGTGRHGDGWRGEGRERGGAVCPGHDLSCSTSEWKTTVLDDSAKARTNQIPCKPNQGTRRLVDARLIAG